MAEVVQQQVFQGVLPGLREMAVQARQKIADEENRKRKAAKKAIKQADARKEAEEILKEATQFVVDYKKFSPEDAYQKSDSHARCQLNCITLKQGSWT
jgi:hypothetical protein